MGLARPCFVYSTYEVARLTIYSDTRLSTLANYLNQLAVCYDFQNNTLKEILSNFLHQISLENLSIVEQYIVSKPLFVNIFS